MSVDMAFYVLGLIGAGSTLVHYIDKAQGSHAYDDVKENLRAMTKGECPQCRSVHPESTNHAGMNDFWTKFHCPECGYDVTAHVGIQDKMTRYYRHKKAE